MQPRIRKFAHLRQLKYNRQLHAFANFFCANDACFPSTDYFGTISSIIKVGQTVETHFSHFYHLEMYQPELQQLSCLENCGCMSRQSCSDIKTVHPLTYIIKSRNICVLLLLLNRLDTIVFI